MPWRTWRSAGLQTPGEKGEEVSRAAGYDYLTARLSCIQDITVIHALHVSEQAVLDLERVF